MTERTLSLIDRISTYLQKITAQGHELEWREEAKEILAIIRQHTAAPDVRKRYECEEAMKEDMEAFNASEIPVLSERDRHEEWKALTRSLPCVSTVARAGWLWSDDEIGMLRAASRARFDESVRTETLFAIAMTGIRIYLSRANKPVSVSLKRCAKSIDPNAFEYEGQEVEHAGDKARRARAIRQAKAVLDEAEVAYVD